MKNKRGVAEGIDWILGIGLFIVSITFIFILFKPGVTPVHDKDTLLNIVQSGFESAGLWNVTEVPIFISPIYAELQGGNTEAIFLADDGHDLDPDDEVGAPDNNYGDQLGDILSEEGYSNMKLFYVVRIDEGREESFPFSGRSARDEVPIHEAGEEEEEAVESYTNEAEEFCRAREIEEEFRGRDRENFEELCGGEDEDDSERGNPRAEEVRRTRVLFVDYARGREEEDPYSNIERENELNFFINDDPNNFLDEEQPIVEEDILIMPALLDATKTKYVLTVASKPINFAVPENFVTPGTMPRKACYAYGGEFQNPPVTSLPEGTDFGQLSPDECFILYELGAKKSTSGLHLPSMLALENFEDSGCETGYGCIKKEWDFPEIREFMIEVETIPEASTGERCDPGQQLCYKFPDNKPGPPLNVNTFVRQFNSFLLTDDGVKIPVIVRITIW